MKPLLCFNSSGCSVHPAGETTSLLSPSIAPLLQSRIHSESHQPSPLAKVWLVYKSHMLTFSKVCQGINTLLIFVLCVYIYYLQHLFAACSTICIPKVQVCRFSSICSSDWSNLNPWKPNRPELSCQVRPADSRALALSSLRGCFFLGCHIGQLGWDDAND